MHRHKNYIIIMSYNIIIIIIDPYTSGVAKSCEHRAPLCTIRKTRMAGDKKMRYQAIVVGGGPAGLVCALRMTERYPGHEILLLEAESHLGGRIMEQKFYNFKLPLGGSMIRTSDVRVQNLCRSLGLELKEVPSALLSDHPELVNDMVAEIARAGGYPEQTTVAEYLYRNFPSDQVDQFIRCSTYRDYLDSDIREFVHHYPMIPDHQQKPDTKAYVIKGGYYRLIEALVDRLHSLGVVIQTSCRVESCTQRNVTTEGGVRYTFGNLYWTVTAQSISGLPKGIQKTLRGVYGVPFLKVFAKLASNNTPFPAKIVGGLIGKIFPLGGQVVQAVYTEAEYAIRLHAMIQETENPAELVQDLLRGVKGLEQITVEDIYYKYWEAGIHQYSPEGRVQISTQTGKIHLIGEAVSTHQGWAEGALETIAD